MVFWFITQFWSVHTWYRAFPSLICIHVAIRLNPVKLEYMSEESYIQKLFAERIGGQNYGKTTAIYKFEKIKRAKQAALKANPNAEIIDMGVGEPDAMAFT